MIPPFLQPNDKIAIISPSGIIDASLIDNAARRLSGWDLQPVIGEFAKEQNGRFAGTKEQRRADLQQALDDKTVKAILCSRGGYGLIQIVDDIDFTQFELFPKWIIGFSDITVLHNAAASLDIASCHSSMAKALSQKDENDAELEKLKNLLFGKLPDYTLKSHLLNRLGKCRAPVTGGNLSVLYSLRGTHFDLGTTHKILFIEDTGEKPYHIDRMLHNLKLGGLFDNLAGLIVGQFSDYDEDPTMGSVVYELIAGIVAEYDYPVCFDFPAGHTSDNMPLVFGVNAELEVGENSLAIKHYIQ